jgi:hypothetical protein
VRTEFVSKAGIPYENGWLVALYVNRAMVATEYRIIPLPEVEGVETTVVRTGEGGLGGVMPPVVLAETGVWGLPEKVATFSSIASCKVSDAPKVLSSEGQSVPRLAPTGQ